MNCSVADMAGSPSNHHHSQPQQIQDPDALDSLPAPPRHLPFRPPKGKNSNTKNLSLMVPLGNSPSHSHSNSNTISPPHTSIEPSIPAPLPFVLPLSSTPVRASASLVAESPLAASFSLGLSRKGSVKRSHVDAEPEDAAYDSDYRSEHKNYHSRTSPKRQSPSPQVQATASSTASVSSVPPFSMEPPPFAMQRRTSQLSISIPLATCSGSNNLPAPLGTPTSQSQHSAHSTASQLSLSDSESDPNSDNTTHTTPPPNYDDALPSKHHLFSEEIMTPSVHHENAYPDGPLLIYPNNVYLYSEPSVELARTFDVVINVAKEIDNPFTEEPYASDGQPNPEYVYVPWGHNSKFLPDLPYLTQLIEDRSSAGKRVLVHCQCGVSRSASLLIAYIMKKQHLDLNAAYDWVKYRSPEIGPNMTLIFQLMDWHKHLLGEKDALESDED
ncbi:Tyrosine-protein phosphatase MSG5 [Yarrowia sp. C11]|nr:Tyrosine-protein phosphatase MSG5 [Yarrowia sp. C11]KAG5365047.1 Tyrosine-protein phosphatase MSG5 [Yarrowia sp. E02]